MKTESSVRVRLAHSAAEVDAAYELAARVFGPSYFEAREAKARALREIEPIHRPEEVVIALDGPQIVGLIRLVARRVRFGDDLLGVTGITSVAVDPAYRALGVGSRLMRYAMQAGRRRGDDVSVLFARRAVDGWYSRFGFVGVGQHVQCQVAGDVSTLLPPAGGRLRLASGFFTPRMVPVFQRVHAASTRQVPGTFQRPADWWKRFDARLRLRDAAEVLTLVAAARRVAGYAVVEGERVTEVAAARADAAAAAGLLVEELRRRGHSVPVFTLHPAHAVMQALARVNHTLSVRHAWDGGHMLAPLTSAAAAKLRAHGVTAAGRLGRVADVTVWPVWTALDEF